MPRKKKEQKKQPAFNQKTVFDESATVAGETLQVESSGMVAATNFIEEKRPLLKQSYDVLMVPIVAFDGKTPGMLFKPGFASDAEKQFKELVDQGFKPVPIALYQGNVYFWFEK